MFQRSRAVYEFVSREAFEVTGRGVAYPVANPVECNDFSHLIGQVVLINGEARTVVGVERFTHAPPWREGEGISLLVQRPPPSEG
jgi:ABC-type antimicrobial peptide transport system ATPase subunit